VPPVARLGDDSSCGVVQARSSVLIRLLNKHLSSSPARFPPTTRSNTALEKTRKKNPPSNMSTVPEDMGAICPDGDMLLTCTTNGELRRFKVSSQTLCTASDVFRAMLGPTSKFKEATELRTAGGTDELYELAIEDDDLKVLRYILLYLHHRNLEVPTEISFQELVQVAVVTDKYDLRVALRFMGELWLQQWKDKPVSRDWDTLLPQSRYENWLLISWVFGEEDIFKRESTFLTRVSVVGEDGHLSFGTGFIVPESVSRESFNQDPLSLSRI